MYLITVDWAVKPEHATWFYQRLLRQAEDSLTLERDCHRFDVAQHETEAGRFLLYEIYTDRAAFDLHLASDHFKAFGAEADAITLRKDVAGWAL
ncbi:MAG: putative quinol monooxygenase [Pseudomonadota bacterium]